MGKFDYKVHHRDQDGQVKRVTPYKMVVSKANGTVLYRDGLAYNPDGSLREDLNKKAEEKKAEKKPEPKQEAKQEQKAEAPKEDVQAKEALKAIDDSKSSFSAKK